MNTRQLATLIAIAKQGTIAAAADVVALTPSALSQQIRSLEAELGVELFDRATRPPSLNAQGLQMLSAAESVLSTIKDIKASLSGQKVTGILNIGTVRTSALALIPQALVALRNAHPALQVKLRTGNSAALQADVLAARIDAAIIAERTPVSENLIWKPFIKEPLIVAAPAGTTQADARTLLTQLPYIRFSADVPLAHLIDIELTQMGVVPTVVAEIDTVPAIMSCVRQGLGAAIVPHVILQDVQNVALVSAEFGQPTIFRQMGLVQKAHNPRSEVLEEFLQLLSKASQRYGIYQPSDNRCDQDLRSRELKRIRPDEVGNNK